MKNNKTRYAVNKQEDEDVEAYVLYSENAVGNTKHSKPQQSADSYKEIMKHGTAANAIKTLNRFK